MQFVSAIRILSLALAVAVAGWVGCTTPTDNYPPTDGQASDAAAEDQTAEEKALSSLSVADRQAAERQKVCPVSDEPLGSMGVPPKIEVNGRTVFLCCDGCEQIVREDPDKYLAKLDGADTAADQQE